MAFGGSSSPTPYTCLAITVAIMIGSVCHAVASEVNTGYFGNVAIKGYDPVAYFTESRAIKGSTEYSLEWLGATWQFTGPEHRDLFAANPISYAPQYGGYCSGGLAYGDRTTNIDPEAWRIIDGKLYLNYDQGTAAELEQPGQLEKIEANWPQVRAQLPAQ